MLLSIYYTFRLLHSRIGRSLINYFDNIVKNTKNLRENHIYVGFGAEDIF
jgi:hypothetical protein